METYKILIVDDDEEWRNHIKSFVYSDCSIEYAENLHAAKNLIDNSFFHAAFVDLRLDNSTDRLTGRDVLEYLARQRPCCRRFLFTDKLQEALDAGDLLGLLQIGRPLIEGIVFKPDLTQRAGAEFPQLINEYLDPSINIQWEPKELGDAIVAAQNIHLADEKVKATRDELNYLISALLGQLPTERKPSPGDVKLVNLERLAGGRSSASVLKGKTELRSGTHGIWLVFKIDSAAKVDEEISRFRLFVKWTLQTNRRVEMLEYAKGDSLGAVCYSFAHSSPAQVTSLENIVRRRSSTAIEIVKNIFEANLEWYAQTQESAPDNGIITFFNKVHGVKPRPLLDKTRDLLEQDEVECGITHSRFGHSTVFRTKKGAYLLLPTDWLGRPQRLEPHLECIVHGDLNLGNIIVPDTEEFSGQWVFIDYAFTGVGPALMDFVVLHIHVLLTFATDWDADAHLEMDRRLLHELSASDTSAVEAPYVEALAGEVLRSMCRTFASCFENHYGDKGHVQLITQFAITSMCWSIRLLRIRNLPIRERLRLLIWMTALRRLLSLREEP